MMETHELLVADECWIALAELHREHPERRSFTAAEIMDRVARYTKTGLRKGVQPHIYLHNVANVPPNSATYRMFYKTKDGYRLYRPGDDFHARRAGKWKPKEEDLPAEYHHLLRWYEDEYCKSGSSRTAEEDPVLAMAGVGQELWKDESGDDFIARERRGWADCEEETPRSTILVNEVRLRITAHEGETFHTSTGLPFTYRLEGNVMWFFRDRRRINMQLSGSELNKAIRDCPLKRTTGIKDIKDMRNYAYVFGLLMDGRIRGGNW